MSAPDTDVRDVAALVLRAVQRDLTSFDGVINVDGLGVDHSITLAILPESTGPVQHFRVSVEVLS